MKPVILVATEAEEQRLEQQVLSRYRADYELLFPVGTRGKACCSS